MFAALASAVAVSVAGGGAAVDERAGTYGGASLADPVGALRRRFGPPIPSQRDEIMPPGAEYYEVGLPPSFRSPPMLRGREGVLRYREMSWFLVGRRAYGFITLELGARSARGVRVGDPQRRVRERYREARCHIANEGTEWPEYPLCEIVVRPGVRLWFGNDPIRSITYVVSADRAYAALTRRPRARRP